MTDPFGESGTPAWSRELSVMGTSVRFETDSRRLLGLVEAAFAGLPVHRLPGAHPRLTVRLVLARGGRAHGGARPPSMRLAGGAGLLVGTIDAHNFAIVSAAARTALVSLSSSMLRFSRLARYELIEFAVLTLITRAQSLVALHAACFGHAGRGILLIGDSGAGKSTLSLQALVEGLEFLAEDSLFATPDSLLLTAAPAFLHLRADSLRFLGRHPLRRRIATSPVIVRRSGVRKYELDLRRARVRLADAPLRLTALIVLSRRRAARAPLNLIPRAAAIRQLERTQPHAVARPEWPRFRRAVARLPAYELGRAAHPQLAIDALRVLLEAPVPARRA